MTKTSVEQNSKLSVDLCYKALGVTFSDPPEMIHNAYLKLKQEYSSEMRDASVSERKTAKDNADNLEFIYATITSSTVYKDYAKEYEKKMQAIGAIRQEQLQKKDEEGRIMALCPVCGKMILRKLKTCPYCNKNTSHLFSTRNISIFLALLLVVIVVTVFLISR